MEKFSEIVVALLLISLSALPIGELATFANTLSVLCACIAFLQRFKVCEYDILSFIGNTLILFLFIDAPIVIILRAILVNFVYQFENNFVLSLFLYLVNARILTEVVILNILLYIKSLSEKLGVYYQKVFGSALSRLDTIRIKKGENVYSIMYLFLGHISLILGLELSKCNYQPVKNGPRYWVLDPLMLKR